MRLRAIRSVPPRIMIVNRLDRETNSLTSTSLIFNGELLMTMESQTYLPILLPSTSLFLSLNDSLVVFCPTKMPTARIYAMHSSLSRTIRFCRSLHSRLARGSTAERRKKVWCLVRNANTGAECSSSQSHLSLNMLLIHFEHKYYMH